MQIIRFLDKQGDIRFGHDHQHGTAELIDGDCLTGSTFLTDVRGVGPRVAVQKLLAPVSPSAIICIGLNYRQHAKEFKAQLPEHPVVFMKNPAALNNPGDPIIIPKCCQQHPEVDYEVELVVVIGRAACNVRSDEALDYVCGYTVGNDVSARRWQKHGGGGQWIRGKSFDTFCPLGPVLVTADEITDPQNLRLDTQLNGIMMQDANTADMIFSVQELISFLSDGTTLLPGTVIMTGTPSGVGFAREPAVFLKDGDNLEMSIEHIGTLLNPVSAE